MSRQWRIEYPGCIYHVMSRGNARQAIYRSDNDRNGLIAMLGELSDRFDIAIYAYVLMGNHYHLLLKTNQANISRAMQWFGSSYTRKFNLNNHSSGHLFQGRFKSIIVENDIYLLRLSCYIHRNPLRAGIVDRLAGYKWSSYLYYAYGKKKPDWLNTRDILDQMSGDDPNKSYRKTVKDYSNETASIWEDVRHEFIYGSQAFIDDIKERFLSDKAREELPQHNRLLKSLNPESMLKRASEYLNFDLDAARTAGKISPAEKDNRDLLIYLLRQTGRLSNTEIGEYFGLSYSAVSRRAGIIHDRIRIDGFMREKYDTRLH